MYILIVVWVLVFLFQHIKFEKIKVKKQVLAVNKKKEIFVNIVRNQEIKSINVKDVKNEDKLELNDGEILRFDGVIKSGIGMFENEKSYKKRGDKVKKNSVLTEGKIIYEIHI